MIGITYVIHELSGTSQYNVLNRGADVFERDNRMYYERRKAQATEQGDRATDLRIAALHYELALLYESLSVHGSKARFEIVGSAGATSSAARSLNAGRHLKLV